MLPSPCVPSRLCVTGSLVPAPVTENTSHISSVIWVALSGVHYTFLLYMYAAGDWVLLQASWALGDLLLFIPSVLHPTLFSPQPASSPWSCCPEALILSLLFSMHQVPPLSLPVVFSQAKPFLGWPFFCLCFLRVPLQLWLLWWSCPWKMCVCGVLQS